MTLNYARQQVVVAFIRSLESHRPRLLDDPIDVAVLGGNASEPELLALSSVRTVSTFGIEDSADIRLDLDRDQEVSDHHRSYDLVLMSQVLEHLRYPANAFMHVARLLRPGGVAWIACPHANFRHGSPDFFASGYSIEALTNWATAAGLHEIASGNWGSRREAEARMVGNLWLNDYAYWPRKNLKKLIRKQSLVEVAGVIRRAPFVYLRSPRFSSNHPMETFGLFGNP